MKLITFDVDGTLVKGCKCHRPSFMYAIHNVLGKTVPNPDVKLPGKIDSEILLEYSSQLGLTPTKEEILACYEAMNSFFAEKIVNDPVQLIDGIKELIIHLHHDDVKLLLLTGNVREIAYAKLKKVGIDSFFIDGAFGTEAGNRSDLIPIALNKAKNHFGKINWMMHIGDTTYDVQAANDHGILSCAVGTGSHGIEILKKQNPSILLKDYTDAYQKIKELM